jgi:hypothetical protein
MKGVKGVVKVSVDGVKESAKLFSQVVDEALIKFPKSIAKQARYAGTHSRPMKRR